jgi:DNA polymerase V
MFEVAANLKGQIYDSGGRWERISCLELDEVAPPKKNICTSRSFGKKVNTFDELRKATASYAAKCAKKLRQQKSCANLITVFIQTNRFSENDRQYYNSKTICMPVATNSDMELIHYATSP